MSASHFLALLLLVPGCTKWAEFEENLEGRFAADNNSTPDVTLLSPEAGDSYGSTEMVSILAVVDDGDDPLVSVTLKFTSDLDGELCVLAPGTDGETTCDTLLSPGEHILKVVAYDLDNKRDEDTVAVSVSEFSDDDVDGDGYSESRGDCDDTDPSVYPGATERLDGVDNDCDGEIDEGTVDYDDDGDGYTERDGDCDDGDAAINPDAAELADGIDNDCDGEVDEGTDSDDDFDGFTEAEGDCDDTDGSVYPDAEELVDGVDNDCDGEIDNDTPIYDDDLDGFSESQGDCDDDNPEVYPEAEDIGDRIDNDCDGEMEEYS